MPKFAKWFVFGVGLVATGVLTLGGVIGLFVVSSQFFAVSAAEPVIASVRTYDANYAPQGSAMPSPDLLAEAVAAPPLAADPFRSVAPPALPAVPADPIAPVIQSDDPFGNSPFGPPPGDAPAYRPSDDPFGGLPGPFTENAPNEAMTLRQKRIRLASLAGEAAALLDAAELDRRISELERMLAEKRADADLAKIQVVLEEITTTFPETPAADKARRMLEAAANQAEDCKTDAAPSMNDEAESSSAIESEPEPLVAPLPAGT